MNSRLLMLAVLAIGCESYAVRTRSSPNGGAYILNLNRESERAVQSTARDVLGDMIAQCSGSYEVTGIDAVPAESGDPDGLYLDQSDQLVHGPYRTVISYECHEPASTDLNHRLYVLAGPSLTMAAGHQPLVHEGDENGCLETWDCPVGATCEARPCDSTK